MTFRSCPLIRYCVYGFDIKSIAISSWAFHRNLKWFPSIEFSRVSIALGFKLNKLQNSKTFWGKVLKRIYAKFHEQVHEKRIAEKFLLLSQDLFINFTQPLQHSLVGLVSQCHVLPARQGIISGAAENCQKLRPGKTQASHFILLYFILSHSTYIVGRS